MQSLLSQTESNAFQSFLSSMDYTEEAIPADEWAAFSASSASMELSYPDADRQALTKATKDLMSLDTNGNWDDTHDTSMMNRSPVIHPHFDDHDETHRQQSPLAQQHRTHLYSSRHDSFPFLHTKSQQQQQFQSIQPPTIQPHPVPPLTGSPDPQPRQQQPSKPNLLSVSQKKANHIQSEQKRRANIRRGYAALCETIPALREAIREEEEAERNAAVNPNVTAVNEISIGAEVRTTNGAGKKRRSRKDAVVDRNDLDDRDKEKIDGRAGPVSENMVLSKTIEHIQHLLTERSSLLTRLQRAKACLPVGHPALTTLNPDPPWEKEWKGGEGKLNLVDGDGDGEGDRDGGSRDKEDDG